MQKREWRLKKDDAAWKTTDIHDEDGKYVCTVLDKYADFIVQAVNHYRVRDRAETVE